MPVRRLHILNCPIGDFARQRQRLRKLFGKICQGINRLGATLNVDRVGFIVIIARPSVGFKKRLNKIFKPSFNMWTKAVVAGVIAVKFKAIEIIPGMEINIPVVLCRLAVPPTAVWQLACATVTSRLARHVEELGISSVFPGSREQPSAE